MKFDFTAVMEDGEEISAQSDARDLRRWEAVYKQSMVGSAKSLTYMTQVAYLAMRRTGALNGAYPTYELFDEKCVELRALSPAEAADDGELVGNPTPLEATEDSFVS